MDKSILLVEDHPLYRAALSHLVQDLVGEHGPVAASSAEEGLRLVDEMTNLSAILLDLSLPGLNGIEAISAFLRKCPDVPVVVVSASENRQEAAAALRAGAIAFVSKSTSAPIMSDLLWRVLAGKLTEPECLTAGTRTTLESIDTLKLSARQNEILSLLLQGHSNKEIGLRLELAEITIKVHVSALFRLLGVVNRTQAVLAARRLGLGTALSE